MFKSYAPNTVYPPFGDYDHGVELPAGARLLSIAGQVGVKPDGSVPESVEAQCELVFRNIAAILGAAGMTMRDLVRMTSYITRPEYYPAYQQVKRRMIGAARPSSTLVVVSGLAKPEWKIEIESWAATAGRAAAGRRTGTARPRPRATRTRRVPRRRR